ncbi:AAA family ATPase [Pedobacter kyonggii]|uniref:AAA family ATPase n=2 Tax=Pedobacter kyonggii TaxID=1926871 RepID=A0A4V2JHA2_9SPHI|nr:AAA family ATPase [Pedobacter kyonggii]
MVLFDDKKFAENANLNLIQGLANQIAIALININSNENIDHREQEKTRLIAFSNAIASVRKKSVIAKVLKKQLKELFGASDFVFFLLNDDKLLVPYIFDEDAKFATSPEFKKMSSSPGEVNNASLNKIIESDEIETFDITAFPDNETPPPFYTIACAPDFPFLTGTTICLGKEVIGVIALCHDKKDLLTMQVKLWKSICSQLAIAISNILANEKISVQLQEINNYKLRLEEEKVYLQEEIETSHNHMEIIGDSPEMKKTFNLVAQVAASDSTVLILGETGTGKELIARAIHNNSPRKDKLMVKVNCAALPANLIESELFGHERGSFTGATERRLGKFELANNGTLFLDEIGEMPLELQVKLLRALQEKEIERIGGNSTIKVDVRIIAATNRNLEREMEEGRFRSDLYYRLKIFPINLPALRHRKEDIPKLASFFISRFSKKSGKKINALSNNALQEMINYSWPGNVREMEHLIERSVLLTTGDSIKNIDLPSPSVQERTSYLKDEEEFAPATIDDNERTHILKTLSYCGGKISGKTGAAAVLGVPTSTLNSKIKRLGIKKEHIRVDER